MLGPYRNKEKMPMKPELFFEEKIIQARMRVPGPIRRIAGIVLFVPVVAISFLLAVLIAPFCWIATGSLKVFWDYGNERYLYQESLCRNPFLRGTTSLFFDNREVYEKIRQLNV